MKTAMFRSSTYRLLLFFLLVCTSPEVSFAATTAELDADEDYLEAVGPVVPDPFEGWNRAVHSFNDGFIEYAARPAYDAYSFVTPSFFRTGVKNFFHNLAFPIRFTNNLLQGKGRAAGVEMSRFILNSTAGIGGLINVAENHKTIVPVDDEDFGQTLGVWGLGEGFYIVWPLLGPSTARDSVGMVGDYFLDPVTYVVPHKFDIGISAFRAFNELDGILDQYDAVNQLAVEPYSSFRNAYIQHRRAKVER